MADNPSQFDCAGCRALQQRVAELERKIAELTKNSRTSSKPPSSDIVTPGGRTRRKGKSKRGGQPGHPRHERPPFDVDQLDRSWVHYYENCPCCGGDLVEEGTAPQVIYQVELVKKSVTIEEHVRLRQRCEHCQKVVCSPWPEELRRAGLVGPQLTALIGYLKGACHMSIGTIKKFFRDVIGVRISRGQLAKVIAKVSSSLQAPVEELLHLLPNQDVLHVDETGHKDSGDRLWTWCFRASLFTVFRISPSRGSDVLIETLGKEFNGLMGCDYFSAYRKYMRLNDNVQVQFCLAHLIRDVRFLAEHPSPENRAYGERLLAHLRRLFRVIHRRDQYSSQAGFQRALERVRADLVWDATALAPGTSETANLAERFYQHTESYFQFITTPGIQPTNNLAEQAIRFVTIHRRLTQGTRGETGQRWVERMATVYATCTQQARSVYEFIKEAVQSYFSGDAPPSLACNTS